MISLQKKTALIKKYGVSKNDVGSVPVQAAILTERISEINQHLQQAKKDKMAQRGLLQLVGRRRRLLAYLARRNSTQHQTILKQLKLRK